MENPIKMDDLGVSLFLETPIYRNISRQIATSDFWIFLVVWISNLEGYLTISMFFFNVGGPMEGPGRKKMIWLDLCRFYFK